jgi:signal transduction histidine kinase
MKSEFLNLASHELRTPVSLMLGYLSLFEEGDLGQLNDRGRRAVEVLRHEARELNALVEQLLEAARMQGGIPALHREEVDLRELAATATDRARGAAGPDHQVILLTPEEPVPVSADRRRLVTALHNLVENAIKYSPHGGEVVCEVRSEAGRAEVRVADRGLGMEPAQIDQLFRPFGRIVTQETASIDGAGLGLYLAKELARLHGGEITVETGAGDGSTFTLTLPLAAG